MRILLSIFILILAVTLSAHGQALRNLNGFGTNISIYGFFNFKSGNTTNLSITPLVNSAIFSTEGIAIGGIGNVGGAAGYSWFFATNAVMGAGGASFIGNGAGLTNLVGATNFSSSVTYNFNGKTTFNSVSYNTNAWGGPTNTFFLTTNYQDFVASTDCNITAIGGQLAGQNTWGTLTVSNSTAGDITVRTTAAGVRPQGPSTTAALIIGAGKEGMLTFLSRDFKSTNYVTSAQQ